MPTLPAWSRQIALVKQSVREQGRISAALEGLDPDLIRDLYAEAHLEPDVFVRASAQLLTSAAVIAAYGHYSPMPAVTAALAERIVDICHVGVDPED